MGTLSVAEEAVEKQVTTILLRQSQVKAKDVL